MKTKLIEWTFLATGILLFWFVGGWTIETARRLEEKYQGYKYEKELIRERPVVVQTIDGCSVYRFYDKDRAVFFSKCGVVK